MGIYNAIFGTNPDAYTILRMLNLTVGEIGRFRDAYVKRRKDGTVVLHVYTRLGGGNRECFCGDESAEQWCGSCYYHHNIQPLQKHPNYIRDYDDDFDRTYATFEFSVPQQFVPLASALCDINDGLSPEESWHRLFEMLNDPKMQGSEEYKQFLERMRPFIDKLKEILETQKDVVNE